MYLSLRLLYVHLSFWNDARGFVTATSFKSKIYRMSETSRIATGNVSLNMKFQFDSKKVNEITFSRIALNLLCDQTMHSNRNWASCFRHDHEFIMSAEFFNQVCENIPYGLFRTCRTLCTIRLIPDFCQAFGGPSTGLFTTCDRWVWWRNYIAVYNIFLAYSTGT